MSEKGRVNLEVNRADAEWLTEEGDTCDAHVADYLALLLTDRLSLARRVATQEAEIAELKADVRDALALGCRYEPGYHRRGEQVRHLEAMLGERKQEIAQLRNQITALAAKLRQAQPAGDARSTSLYVKRLSVVSLDGPR